jgi:hypothetical protein
MRKQIYLPIFILIFISFLSINSYADGWEKDSRGWRYYENNENEPGGTYIKNEVKTIDNDEYLFDEDGYITKGWWNSEYELGNDKLWYYFGKDGKLVKTNVEDNGVKYYFHATLWYCLNPNGETLDEFTIKYMDWSRRINEYTSVINSFEIEDEDKINKRLELIDEFYSLPKEIPQKYLYEVDYVREKFEHEKKILTYKKELINLSKEPNFNEVKAKEIMINLAGELHKVNDTEE